MKYFKELSNFVFTTMTPPRGISGKLSIIQNNVNIFPQVMKEISVFWNTCTGKSPKLVWWRCEVSEIDQRGKDGGIVSAISIMSKKGRVPAKLILWF